MNKQERVLSFDDFVKKESATNKNPVPKKVESKKVETTSKVKPIIPVAMKVPGPTIGLNQTKPVKESTIAPIKSSVPVRRTSKNELVNILNNVFSDRAPAFNANDISWEFLSEFNNKTKLIASKKDLTDPDFYNKTSEELNALTGILTELMGDYDLNPYTQDEDFLDSSAKTINDNLLDAQKDNNDIEQFHIDDEVDTTPVNLYESTILVEDSYKVKTTFSVSANLLEEYKNKVKEETGEDVNKSYTDSELAEQMVEYILQKYLLIDNIPTSLAVGENTIDHNQEKAEQEATNQSKEDVNSEGNINVEEHEEEIHGGLLGLDEAKIEYFD